MDVMDAPSFKDGMKSLWFAIEMFLSKYQRISEVKKKIIDSRRRDSQASQQFWSLARIQAILFSEFFQFTVLFYICPYFSRGFILSHTWFDVTSIVCSRQSLVYFHASSRRPRSEVSTETILCPQHKSFLYLHHFTRLTSSQEEAGDFFTCVLSLSTYYSFPSAFLRLSFPSTSSRRPSKVLRVVFLGFFLFLGYTWRDFVFVFFLIRSACSLLKGHLLETSVTPALLVLHCMDSVLFISSLFRWLSRHSLSPFVDKGKDSFSFSLFDLENNSASDWLVLQKKTIRHTRS